MRNREGVLRKLDGLESNLNKLVFNLNTGSRDQFLEVIESLREQIEQLKLYIESEPITGNELNRLK